MKGPVLIALIFANVLAYTGMMNVKTDVRSTLKQRNQLIKEQQQLKESIRVLKAEVAYLTSPARLYDLAVQRGYVEVLPSDLGTITKKGGI